MAESTRLTPSGIQSHIRVEAADDIAVGLPSVEPSGLKDRVAFRAAVLVRQNVVIGSDERLLRRPSEAAESAGRDREVANREATHRGRTFRW